jgi:GNAT superfamily N-acetyltransferase
MALEQITSCEILPVTDLVDPEQVVPVLESAVRNPFTNEVFKDEVAGILADVEAVWGGSESMYYAVAVSAGGKVLGMMGLKRPSERLREVAEGANPIELVNAAVLDSVRGQGVGNSLVNHLEDYGLRQGHDEVILTSGPRYQFSGWPFWTRQYGPPHATLERYFDNKYHAKVWSTPLPRPPK